MIRLGLLPVRVALAGLTLAGALAVAGPASTISAADCQFVLGFKVLHDLDPADVGDCTANQAFTANGDAQQPTNHGLLVWRKADNFTAFTDGYHSWVNGPYGLQERLNGERFSWEAPSSNATVAPAVYTSVATTTAQPDLTAMATKFFNLLNDDREQNGLAPLALNAQLSAFAQTRAQGLLSADGVLSHYDANGDGQLVLKEVMDANSIPYVTAGENLAENNYDLGQTVSVANTGLMNSPTHRANILNTGYTQVGIGLAGPDPAGRFYYVQWFLQTA